MLASRAALPLLGRIEGELPRGFGAVMVWGASAAGRRQASRKLDPIRPQVKIGG